MAASITTANSNYEFDYSQPNLINKSITLNQKSASNIATAMVINPNMNYHFINNNSSITSNNMETTQHDSGLDMSNTNNTSLNNVTNQINNFNISSSSSSPLSNKDLIQANFNFFGASTNGNFGYSASLMTSAQLTAGLENKCLRCSNQVYALERIGPIKGNIYHKTCFKCLVCDRQLDLKTYYTNQIDLNDRQIYCQSHAPKCGKGIFGADSIMIHNVLNAPKLDVMQKVDNKPKANIDGSARHIMHAVHAQHLVQMGNRKDMSQMHSFPAYPVMSPANLKAREAIRKAQEILEAKQRAEEDILLQVTFYN